MARDRRPRSPWLLFIVAPLLPVCAALLRVEFLGALGAESPFLTFYPAVVAAALLAGFPAGLFATLLSACLASYLWIDPVGTLLVAHFADRLALSVFLVSGASISAGTEYLLRTQARAEEVEARSEVAVEREQASLAIQMERNFLRQVIDAFPNSIFVKDEQGTLHLVNQAMATFHGTTVEAMEGRRLAEFGAYPDELEARFSMQGEAVFDPTLPSAADLHDPRGTLHHFETDKSPLFNDDGSCNKLLVIATDVTERAQAEEALHANRELLNSIIAGTPDAIYVKDTVGRYLLFNRAAEELAGKRGEEVLGREDSVIFPLQDALLMAAEDQSVMAGRSIQVFEDALMDVNGRKRVFLTTKGPLYDGSGNISGIFGISRDISEQKLAEDEFRNLHDELDKRVAERTAQLEAVNREQEFFSYSVSHALRSPLRHINSYAAVLMEELGSGVSPEGRDNLERICKASNKTGRLIDDLLKLARTSRLPLSEELIDLSRLATISSLMLQQTDKTRRVEFTIAEGMQVLGDKTLMRLVLENLLNNAWKYTVQEKLALIEVGTEIMDGQEVYYVSDNGTGFDMEYHDKLFGAFQRLHGSEFEGNGIGLATVKRAIERHGGSIWAEGEVGSGATFYFTLGKQAMSYPRQLRQSNA